MKRNAFKVWLELNRPRELWTRRIGGGVSADLTAYDVDGKVLLYMEYDDGGWDVWVPACESNEAAPTIAALDAWAGRPQGREVGGS